MKPFNILGTIQIVEGKKKLVLNSPEHFSAMIQRFPVGKELVGTFSDKKLTRSRAQLSYFHVLAGYIANHTGFTEEEMYPILIMEKFGTEKKEFRGRTWEVRRSVSDMAQMNKNDMAELIEHALMVCAELEIRVPSKEQLGYIEG